jgi:hypothetical protein
MPILPVTAECPMVWPMGRFTRLSDANAMPFAIIRLTSNAISDMKPPCIGIDGDKMPVKESVQIGPK